MYLTRNQAYRKVPWVRIPPSPPRSKQTRALAARFCFVVLPIFLPIAWAIGFRGFRTELFAGETGWAEAACLCVVNWRSTVWLKRAGRGAFAPYSALDTKLADTSIAYTGPGTRTRILLVSRTVDRSTKTSELHAYRNYEGA